MPHRHRHSRRALAAAVVTAAAAFTAPTLRADTDTWTTPAASGTWSNPVNWSLGHAPAATDAAALTNATATDHTALLDVNATVAALTLDATGTGRLTLVNTPGFPANLTVTGDETVGLSGAALSIVQQTAGSATISGNLYLAYNAHSDGVYVAAGQTVTANNIYLGGSATAAGGLGTFSTLAATNITTNTLKIWNNPGVGNRFDLNGNSTLTAATLDTGGNTQAFNWLSGSLHITGAAGFDTAAVSSNGFSLTATRQLTVDNTFRLSANSSVFLSAGKLTVGALDASASPGNFSWSGGALEITGPAGLTPSAANLGANLYLGNLDLTVDHTLDLPAGSSFNLASGSLTAGAIDTHGTPSRIAFSSGGQITVTGPAGLSSATLGSFLTLSYLNLTVTNTLTIPANNSVSLSGSSLTVGAIDDQNPTSHFSFVGGALTVTGPAGFNLAAIGPSPSLQGNTSITVTNTLTVPSTTTNLGIFGATGSAGTLVIDSPNVTFASGKITAADSETLGATHVATFTQSGGAHTIATPGANSPTAAFYLGHDAGASGTYTLQNSQASLTVNAPEYVGYSGVGNVKHQNGSHTINGDLFLAYNAQSNGNYTLSAGTLTANNLYVGGSASAQGGTGVFIQNGGAATIAGTTRVYHAITSSSRLLLSAGTFTTDTLDVQSPADLQWSGGTLAVTGGLASPAPLTVPTSGTLLLSAPAPSFTSLSVLGHAALTPAGHHLLTATSLGVSAGGSLDLSDNDLLLDYAQGTSSPIAQVRQSLAIAAGPRLLWTNPGGITSSTAAALANHTTPGPQTALGYAEASQYKLLTHTDFLDDHPVDDSAVLVMYTYAGDATLDGTVDDNDVNALAAHFDNGLTTNLWTDGDFTYDGLVDARDVDVLSSTFGLSDPAFRISPAGYALLQSLAPVPDPSFALAAPVVACLVAARRRRRIHRHPAALSS